MLDGMGKAKAFGAVVSFALPVQVNDRKILIDNYEYRYTIECIQDWKVDMEAIEDHKEQLEHNSLVDTIVEKLETMIINGTLKPGERIFENKLCERLGVSRSPIREAFRILEGQGFLVNQPRKGVSVARASFKEATDAYVIRANLESLAIVLTVQKREPGLVESLKVIHENMKKLASLGDEAGYIRANDEFHEIMVKACGNDQLIQMLGRFVKQTARYRKMVFVIPGKMDESLDSHEMLIRSIEFGDAEGAGNIRKNSILTNIRLLEKLFQGEEKK